MLAQLSFILPHSFSLAPTSVLTLEQSDLSAYRTTGTFQKLNTLSLPQNKICLGPLSANSFSASLFSLLVEEDFPLIFCLSQLESFPHSVPSLEVPPLLAGISSAGVSQEALLISPSVQY